TVYEAEATRLRRRVAIKVVRPDLGSRDEMVVRFELEAQAAGRIGSEHIVEVFDLGALETGARYMVMEFLDGESLRDRLSQRTRLSAEELYPLAYQLLEGLSAAHLAGIVHRDLKPDNVFILKKHGGRTDFVKLVDFGISKFALEAGDAGMSMTRTGAVLGTPYYMSPEQARGSRSIDHRVDLYATGVIMYECLAGTVPFHAESLNELIFKIALETAPPIQTLAPGIDPRLAEIVTKAMARDAAERFQSATEFQQALTHWAASSSAVRPPQMRTETVAASFPADFVTPRPSYAPPAGARLSGPPLTPSHQLQAGTSATWSKSGSLSSSSPELLRPRWGRRLALAAGGIGLASAALAWATGAFRGGEPSADLTAVTQDPPASAGSTAAQAGPPNQRVDEPRVEPIAPSEPRIAVESYAQEAQREPAPPPRKTSAPAATSRARPRVAKPAPPPPSAAATAPVKEAKPAAVPSTGLSHTSKGRPIRTSL
ncbi:MAG TPA: protein kinase, partial [Polyangiaceae bacterium]|nr:protein kinase [Polyangiaceae bacterium]